MCFCCGYRICRECVALEDGLCPQCGGVLWVDMTTRVVTEGCGEEFDDDEEDGEDEDDV